MCLFLGKSQRNLSESRQESIEIHEGTKDPKGGNLYLIGYTDANFVVDGVDRKSTSRIGQFLGYSLVSEGSKKQNSDSP